MKIEGEPKNCGYCYFLGEIYFPTEKVCKQTGSLIKDTKVCLSGILYRNTTEELKKIREARKIK